MPFLETVDKEKKLCATKKKILDKKCGRENHGQSGKKQGLPKIRNWFQKELISFHLLGGIGNKGAS